MTFHFVSFSQLWVTIYFVLISNTQHSSVDTYNSSLVFFHTFFNLFQIYVQTVGYPPTEAGSSHWFTSPRLPCPAHTVILAILSLQTYLQPTLCFCNYAEASVGKQDHIFFFHQTRTMYWSSSRLTLSLSVLVNPSLFFCIHTPWSWALFILFSLFFRSSSGQLATA